MQIYFGHTHCQLSLAAWSWLELFTLLVSSCIALTQCIPEVWNWCRHEWSVQINIGGENYHGIIHAILCKHFENIIMDTDSWTFFPLDCVFKFCPSTFCTHHAVSQRRDELSNLSYDVTFSWRVVTFTIACWSGGAWEEVSNLAQFWK